MEGSEFPELIPGLPEELGLECLTRLPYSAHGVASQVCRRWRLLLKSKEFYFHRKKHGYTRKLACLVQSTGVVVVSCGGMKQSGSPSYGITVFDPVSRTCERLPPIPKYPNGLPLFCQVASSEGKLVLTGGWDPVSYEPVKDVFVYDFTIRRWKQGKEMAGKRSFFAIGACSGRVLVAGGHDENKNAISSGWVYDVNRNEWSELPPLSQERDECEGLVIGDEFWVVSGYGTETQGAFEGSAEVYGIGSGEWRRVEGVWEAGRCPKSCVGVGKDGGLANLGELDPVVRVGVCGVMMGNRVLVTGSEYEGAAQGFYTAEMVEGQNGKIERIDTGDGFSGFVQSGCCVEI